MTEKVTFSGKCHDCGCDVNVDTIEINGDPDNLQVVGGAIYWPDDHSDEYFVKCDACHKKDPVLRRFQTTEVYTRIVGYMRPVSQWGKGKAAEFQDRKTFDRTFRLPDEAA